MYIPDIETKNTEEIRRYQESRLVETLGYLNENSSYYQRLFRDYNIDVSSIRRMEDLQRIPVTTKDDLQKNTDDFLCVDKKKIVDYITTSGTMGEPGLCAQGLAAEPDG